jgi:hypothetical protein
MTPTEMDSDSSTHLTRCHHRAGRYRQSPAIRAARALIVDDDALAADAVADAITALATRPSTPRRPAGPRRARG